MKATKSNLTREINKTAVLLVDLEDCYYNKNWNSYLGEPIYPQIAELRKDLFYLRKERESLEPQYYFKFCVPDSQAHYFNNYKAAAKKAKKLDEKIWLQIYHKKNPYKEVYAEIAIFVNEPESRIIELKENLIISFNKLTKATPEANLNGTRKNEMV